MPLTTCIVTLRAGSSKSFLRCPRLRNWGAVNNKIPKDFLHNFRSFRTVSAPFHLLSVTLQSHYFHVFRTALWLKMWSKRLPSFASGPSADAEGRRFLFSGRLHGNAEGGIQQGLSAVPKAQNLRGCKQKRHFASSKSRKL